MSWLRILGTAILMAFVLSLTVGSVESAIPNPTNKKFYACMHKKTNAIRMLDVPTKRTCAKGWKRISWNAKGNPGATGPAGPQGPAGPAGAPGSAGITKITLTQVQGPTATAPAGGVGTGQASCDTGKAVSGGLWPSSSHLHVTTSVMRDPKTWETWVHNTDEFPNHHTFIPYVICMTTDPGAVIASKKSDYRPAGKKALKQATTSKQRRR